MIITNSYSANGEFCAFIHKEELDEVHLWPDEKGNTPRDMSIGYTYIKGFGRLHVFPQQILINKIKNK